MSASTPGLHATERQRLARLAALLLAGTAIAGLPISSASADDTWTGAASTDWFTASNWSNNAAPTSGGTATIATTAPNATVINGGAAVSDVTVVGYQSGAGQLTISGGGVLTTPNGLSVGDSSTPDTGSGSVLVTGAGSQINVATGTVMVGAGSNGTLTIRNGGAVSAFQVMAGATSSGTINVDGNGSTLTAQNFLSVADGPGTNLTGVLAITDGGVVHSLVETSIGSSPGTGTATVDGAGSSLETDHTLGIGDSGGTGLLAITNGGSASAGTETLLGEGAFSSGTLTVGGAHSTFTSASLTVGDGGTGTLAISNGGLVTSAAGLVATAAGSIGDVTVDGTNSTWTIADDLVVSSGNGGSGTVAISNGGGVSVGGNFYVAYAPDSTGALTISSGGTASVVGNFSLATQSGSTGALNIGAAAGSAAVAPGTLDAASVQFGSGNGTINFNHTSSDYIFAPALSGIGTINQIAGDTDLVTNSVGFSGDVNVTGGRLAVDALLPNAQVVVSGGGILGGNGVVGGIDAEPGGIVAPGHSIGTLHVDGDVAFVSGSTYQVQLNSIGVSDQIVASGTAVLLGGTVQVLPAAGAYGASTQYTILTATGGVFGSFAGTSGSTPFLTYGLTYDTNDVYLDVDRSSASFASVGATPNQIATGGGAESLGSGNLVYNAIVLLPTAAAAQDAFDQLSGEIHASTKGMLVEDSHFIRDAATSRIDAAFGDAGAAPLPVMAYGDGGPELVAADTDRFAVWGQAFGSWGNTGSDGNAAAFDHSTGGLLAGADTLAGGWRVGVLGGYSHSSFNVDARNSSGTGDSYHLGLYGGTNWGALAFRTGAAYSWSSISTKRSVAFNGFADALSAGYDAGTAQAFGELAYKIEANRFAFEPFVNLAYVSVKTDGFTEAGGEAALTSAGSTTNATFTTLGLRGSTDLAFGGIDATARGKLGWRHAFGDVTPTSSFAFAGGDTFTIAGVPIARDAAIVGAGLDLKMSANATLGLSYTGQFGGGATDNGATANLSVKF